MSNETFEFEVTVTVRKRIWVSGPRDRETARKMLAQAIPSMGCGAFAKRNAQGHDIETLLSNDVDVQDAHPEDTLGYAKGEI